MGDTDIPYEPNPKGKVPEDWWDVPQLNSNAPERVGYPTQKPPKLLDRIIRASSNEGDVVLDPFCGCATTCVSAHALGRMWTGIDISPRAAELIVQRLSQDYLGGADVLDDARAESHPLHRAPAAHGRGQAAAVQDAQAHALRQAGGQVRRVRPPLPVPELHGGAHRDTDHLDNLQLLCNHCNSVKGTMDQAAFKVKLSTMGLGA